MREIKFSIEKVVHLMSCFSIALPILSTNCLSNGVTTCFSPTEQKFTNSTKYGEDVKGCCLMAIITPPFGLTAISRCKM